MKIDVPKPVAHLQQLLAHHKVFLVGGFVRNSLMGNESTDYDVCSALTPNQLIDLTAGKATTKLVSAKLGTVNILLGGAVIEHTTFRSDTYLPNGKHEPNNCTFITSVKNDAKRRDFTINAIYASAKTGKVTDFCEGISDLKSKTVRSVQNPNKTFLDDPLRILRMARFAACLGFGIDESTISGATTNANRLKVITRTRILDEINKTLQHGLEAFNQFLGILQQTGALKVMFGCDTLPLFEGVALDDAVGHYILHVARCINVNNAVPNELFYALPNKKIKQVCLALLQFDKTHDAFLLFEQTYPHADYAIRLVGYKNKAQAAALTKQLQQAQKSNLYTSKNSLDINGYDIATHFPCIKRQNYATILTECKKNVFNQKVQNTKTELLQEIKKYV